MSEQIQAVISRRSKPAQGSGDLSFTAVETGLKVFGNLCEYTLTGGAQDSLKNDKVRVGTAPFLKFSCGQTLTADQIQQVAGLHRLTD